MALVLALSIGSSMIVMASTRFAAIAVKARSNSFGPRASNCWMSSLSDLAASSIASRIDAFEALCGLMRTATLFVRGKASLSSSSRFALTSKDNHVRPVTFPPGRARLATNSVATGLATAGITMGIVAVACLAARAPGVPWATMTSTLRRTSSAASSGSRSCLPSAQRNSMVRFLPST